MKKTLAVLLAVMFLLPVFAQSASAPNHQKTVGISAVAVAQVDQGNPDIKVWVNTNSGVYHCPGTRWYGNTKHGEYMTQREAQKKGYRPAYGKVCR